MRYKKKYIYIYDLIHYGGLGPRNKRGLGLFFAPWWNMHWILNVFSTLTQVFIYLKGRMSVWRHGLSIHFHSTVAMRLQSYIRAEIYVYIHIYIYIY